MKKSQMKSGNILTNAYVSKLYYYCLYRDEGTLRSHRGIKTSFPSAVTAIQKYRKRGTHLLVDSFPALVLESRSGKYIVFNDLSIDPFSEMKKNSYASSDIKDLLETYKRYEYQCRRVPKSEMPVSDGKYHQYTSKRHRGSVLEWENFRLKMNTKYINKEVIKLERLIK
jgi:hypothetical protein